MAGNDVRPDDRLNDCMTVFAIVLAVVFAFVMIAAQMSVNAGH